MILLIFERFSHILTSYSEKLTLKVSVRIFETFPLQSSVSDFHRIRTNQTPNPPDKNILFSDYHQTRDWEGANRLRMPVCKAEAHRALELLEDYYRFQSNL